jgi:hypothetical protein
MDNHTAVVVLFAASAVSAFIAAIREDWIPKVHKLALAVAFAATAFLVQVTNFLGK